MFELGVLQVLPLDVGHLEAADETALNNHNSAVGDRRHSPTLEEGEDAETTLDEIKESNDQIDKRKLTLDSDPRYATRSGNIIDTSTSEEK